MKESIVNGIISALCMGILGGGAAFVWWLVRRWWRKADSYATKSDLLPREKVVTTDDCDRCPGRNVERLLRTHEERQERRFEKFEVKVTKQLETFAARLWAHVTGEKVKP